MIKRDFEVPRTAEAIPAARALARELISDHVEASTCDDVTLIVSELVTNAVRHGSGEAVTVALSVGDGVRVDVRDGGGKTVPAIRHQSDDGRPGGWGLVLVDRIAHEWGVVTSGFTQVWCVLR